MNIVAILLKPLGSKFVFFQEMGKKKTDDTVRDILKNWVDKNFLLRKYLQNPASSIKGNE